MDPYKLIIICIISLQYSSGQKEEDERTRLFNDLLEKYDVRVRPVTDPSQTLRINGSMQLGELISLDEQAQVFTGKWYLHMKWKDAFLKWNPDDYGGIQMLVIQANRVWAPDMKCMSSVDPQNPLDVIDKSSTLDITSEGVVHWDPVFIARTSCDVHVADFPFDKQVCPIGLESWMQTENQVSYHPADMKLDLSKAVKHSLWTVSKQVCEKKSQSSSHSNERKKVDVLICKVHLWRKPLYYMFNTLLPVIILLIMGSLCFFLPVNDGGRVGLSVTVLLAMTVLMIMVMHSLPVTSDGVPDLEIFMGLCMLILGSCTVMSVGILNMYRRREGTVVEEEDRTLLIVAKPPYWMVVLFLKVFATITMHRYRKELGDYDMARKKIKTMQRPRRNTVIFVEGAGGIENGDAATNEPIISLESRRKSVAAAFTNEKDQKMVNCMLRRVWVAMAHVLDRVCFTIYIICCVSMLIFVFSKAGRRDDDERDQLKEGLDLKII